MIYLIIYMFQIKQGVHLKVSNMTRGFNKLKSFHVMVSVDFTNVHQSKNRIKINIGAKIKKTITQHIQRKLDIES